MLLSIFFVLGVLATGYLAGRSRRWTALGVALAPAVILGAFINWDLIAMGLAMLGMAAWAARRGVLAGVLIGLAVATKFYPVLFLGPLLLLCWRAGRLRSFWVTAASAAVTWLVVNVPVMIINLSGWARFYQLSETRSADWGSIWYFFETEHWPVIGTTSVHSLNAISSLVFLAACVGIALLIMAAPRRPRLPQVFFLVLAVFLLSNKVWSPQYVVWLAPLVVLARPRWGAYLLWQLAEVGYFFAIWAYLITVSVTGPAAVDGISGGLYFAALLARFLTVLLLCALVIRDILHPAGDVVRAAGRTTRPVACWLAPRTGWCCGCGGYPRWLRSQRMSVAGSGVSQMTGAPAERITSTSSIGSIVPCSIPACRSRPELNSSRELLQCTRSIRPVMALTRSAIPASSSPLA